ncbi:unnamed protein product [Lepeophtheirus salmonis]|uniref:(salmon louse) hypothetical protein n=1 Tax=Lepeophtheirus salmonis TaxID=72036 RepID=A0A817FCK1_LEPSM|nr:unnamed protein product [Lepeophtheirus salmonis]CAG9476560.1 unnamed protein product [Lepeophtheirus salmonis]
MFKFGHVIDLVTKVTNIIQGGNIYLYHRRFITFLDEVDAQYGDLQMHRDIRQMSRGKYIEQFFVLCSEMPVLFENTISGNTSMDPGIELFYKSHLSCGQRTPIRVTARTLQDAGRPIYSSKAEGNFLLETYS